jgi:hypothetical protein
MFDAMKSAMTVTTNKKLNLVRDQLPPVGKRVSIVCEDVRCIGYRDALGIWREDNTRKQLTEVIGWTDLFD